MIHLTGMRQFVQQHVVYQMFGKEHQIIGQIDVAPCRTAPPTPATGINLHTFVRKVMLHGKHIQARRKNYLCIPPQSLFNHFTQPSLQVLIREIRIRRTDYLHLPQFRTGQETFALSADQRQLKELRINTIIQINQSPYLLLPGSPQTRAKLFYGTLYLGKRSPGRHSHINAILLCTESETPRPDIDPDKQDSKLFIFYNAVYCHTNQELEPLPPEGCAETLQMNKELSGKASKRLIKADGVSDNEHRIKTIIP